MKNMSKKEKEQFMNELKKSMSSDKTLSASEDDPNSLKININLQKPEEKDDKKEVDEKV